MQRTSFKQYSAALPWAIRVAEAAPATPQRNAITNRPSKAIFTREAISIASSGVLESPTALSMEAITLYAA